MAIIKHPRILEIISGYQRVKKVKSCRYLGLIIDDELKWSEHIDTIYSCLLKYVGIFYKLRNKVPAGVMKNVYYAFVHSHILYGIELYANTFSTYIDRLIKLNNKILRILLNQSRFCSVNELYTSFNTLSIPVLHKRQILMLVHNTLYHSSSLPDVFANYFTLNSSVHAYIQHALILTSIYLEPILHLVKGLLHIKVAFFGIVSPLI